MESHLKRNLTRQLTGCEIQILREAGEQCGYVNYADRLPFLESMKTFVLLCNPGGFNNADAFWKEYRLLDECLADVSRFYIHTPIPKGNGKGYRHVYKVDERLAAYQRTIKNYILDLLDERYTSKYAYAYKRGRSVSDNARPHAGHDFLVKMDIANFFDSTRQSTVYGIFDRHTKYNKEVKTILTKLVCIDGHLCQGACTSPQLANLALSSFDELVGEFCHWNGITYTRYCDDMTFSSESEFDAKALICFVSDQLKFNHYRPNTRKTRVFRKGSRHVVTGIVVNNEKLRVPSEYKHNLRQDLYYVKKFGVTSHLERKNLDGFGSVFSSVDKRHEESYINMLIGRAAFACGVDPEDRELKAIGYELYECLRDYSRQFREDYLRHVRKAASTCSRHILMKQESCFLMDVTPSFYSYEGLTIHVGFRPKKGNEKYAFRYLVWLIRENELPALKTHQLKCKKRLDFTFRIPIHEFSDSERVIGGCLDDLLTLYGKMKLKGYV